MTGGPDDGADAGSAQVEVGEHADGGEGPGAPGFEYLVVKPVGVDVLVDPAEQPVAWRASAAATVAGRSGARRTRWPSTAVTLPRSRTPAAWRVARSSGRRSGRADQLGGRLAAGQRRSGISSIVLSRCRCARATSRCPCRGSGAACGCGCRRRSSRLVRPRRARRRSGRRSPMRRRPAPRPAAASPGCGTRSARPGGYPRPVPGPSSGWPAGRTSRWR